MIKISTKDRLVVAKAVNCSFTVSVHFPPGEDPTTNLPPRYVDTEGRVWQVFGYGSARDHVDGRWLVVMNLGPVPDDILRAGWREDIDAASLEGMVLSTLSTYTGK